MPTNVTRAVLAVLWVSSPALALEAPPGSVAAPATISLAAVKSSFDSPIAGPAPASLPIPAKKLSETCVEKSCPEKDALSREAAKALIDIFRLALAGGGSEAAAIMK